MKEPDAILLPASSKSESSHINSINKKHEKTNAYGKVRETLSVLIIFIKNLNTINTSLSGSVAIEQGVRPLN